MFIFTDTDIADVISRPINDCGDKLQKIREDLLNGKYEKEIFTTTCCSIIVVKNSITVCDYLNLTEISKKIDWEDSIENVYNEIFTTDNLENQCVIDLKNIFETTKQKIVIQAFLIINDTINKIRDLGNENYGDYFATGNEFRWQTEEIFDFLKQNNKEITIKNIKKGYPKQQKLFLW